MPTEVWRGRSRTRRFRVLAIDGVTFRGRHPFWSGARFDVGENVPMVRFGEPRWWLGACVGSGLLIAVASGCGESDRPSPAAWRSQWEPVAREVPAPSQADDLDPARCERLLVAARQARPELEPAPTKALDAPTVRWLDLAEEVGFECEDTVDLHEVLVELDELADRIDEGLVADPGG